MSDTTTTPEEVVSAAISAPESYEIDGEKITSRKLTDVIEAAKFLVRRKCSCRNAFRALGVSHISTPGADE